MSEKKKIPKGWAIERLGDVCFTTSGGTPSRKNSSYYQGNIPWVKSGELDNGVITKTEEYISEEAVENSSAKIFPKGTLLIALYGATIGKLGFLGIDAATNQAICGIFKNEIIDLQFLKYYLFNKRNKLIEQGAGGAQPNISQTILKDLDVILPPLPEQHRIVAKIEVLFSSLDKGIESLKTAQQQLKIYRQAVLKWAFEGRLNHDLLDYLDDHDLKNEKNQGENKCLNHDLLDYLDDHDLKNENEKNQGNQGNHKNQGSDNLPEGWKRLTLGDIAIRNSQKVLPSEMPDAKFIGMDCIEPNTLKPLKFYEFKEFKSAGNVFRKNQVLYGRMRPYLNKVYKAEIDGTCSGEFIVLDCLNGFDPELLKYILHHRDFVSFANHKTSGDRPRISFEEIAGYPVNVCKPEEQHLIVSEIEFRLSVCDKIEESITTSLQQAEALRQSILKKAFEGKLVEQDPNDEPASVLLERIRAERVKNKQVKVEKKSRKSK